MSKSGSAKYRRDLAKFERDLGAALDPKVINKRLIDRYGDEIIKAMIHSAHLGIGPGNKPYPAYSPQYEAAKKSKQGDTLRNWLRGLQRTGGKGGMLDPKNFSWEIDARGGLWLVWTAPDEQTGIYAEVHNEGLPLGPGGPRKKREFMHFETTDTLRIVWAGYDKAMDEIAAEFSAGYTIR